jgi:hypothetical protein
MNVMLSYSGRGNNNGGIFIPLTVVRVWIMVILKETFLGWQSNYEGRLKSSWTAVSPRNFQTALINNQTFRIYLVLFCIYLNY